VKPSSRLASGSPSAWLATMPKTRDMLLRRGSWADVVNVCHGAGPGHRQQGAWPAKIMP
jgi:hypothetical protein